MIDKAIVDDLWNGCKRLILKILVHLGKCQLLSLTQNAKCVHTEMARVLLLAYLYIKLP
jgi:hypothetical protein